MEKVNSEDYCKHCKKVIRTRDSLLRRLNCKLPNPRCVHKTPHDGGLFFNCAALQINSALFALFLSRVNILVSLRGQPFTIYFSADEAKQHFGIDISNLIGATRPSGDKKAKDIAGFMSKAIAIFRAVCERHSEKRLETMLNAKDFCENNIDMKVFNACPDL